MEDDSSARRSASFHSSISKSPSFLGLRRTLSSSRSDGLWEQQDPEKGLVGNFLDNDEIEEAMVPWVANNSGKRKRSVRVIRAGQSMWRQQTESTLEATGAAMHFVAKNLSASSRLLMIGCAAILVMVGCLSVSDMVSGSGGFGKSGASSGLLHHSESYSSRPSRRLMEAKTLEERIGSAIAGEVIRKVARGKLSKVINFLQNPSRLLPPIEKIFTELMKEDSNKAAGSMEAVHTMQLDASTTGFLDGNKTLLYSPSLYEMCLPTVREWREAFLCAVGDAINMGRTWVMDSQFCVAADSIPGHPYQSVLDFHLYYDLDRLEKKLDGKVMESSSFWNEFDVFNTEIFDRKVGVMDVSPSRRDLQDELQPIIRRAVQKTDEKSWSSVCEHDKAIEKPQDVLQIHPALMDIAVIMFKAMGNDFDSVHVTIDHSIDESDQVESVIARIKTTIKTGRRIFLSIGEVSPHLFDSLRNTYRIFTIHDFHQLWGPSSDWANAMKGEAGHKSRVIFDSYMRFLVNEELINRSKEKIDTAEPSRSSVSNGKRSTLRLRMGGWKNE